MSHGPSMMPYMEDVSCVLDEKCAHGHNAHLTVLLPTLASNLLLFLWCQEHFQVLGLPILKLRMSPCYLWLTGTGTHLHHLHPQPLLNTEMFLCARHHGVPTLALIHHCPICK